MGCHLLSFVMNIYETTSGNVINPASGELYNTSTASFKIHVVYIEITLSVKILII